MSKLPTHTTSPQKLAMLAQVLQQYPGSRSDSQRQRIIAALAQAACTSSELQRHLDCYDCNARIHELRHRDGQRISMIWVQQETEAGELHRVGLFFLDMADQDGGGAEQVKASGKVSVRVQQSGALSDKACCSPGNHATMHPALKGAGAEHTISVAVQTPTDKRRFVMPEYLVGRGVSTASRHGCGQDAPVRKTGGTATDVCSTSCPPYALEHATGGFLIVPVGA